MNRQSHQPAGDARVAARRTTSNIYVTGVYCAAEVLCILGVFAFPSVQDDLASLWKLTATHLGWINGIFYAAYAIAVCGLTPLTDRVDARRVVLIGAAITVLANLGFAAWAAGLWSALAFRALAGVGFAGTFMPGLRALLDRLPPDGATRGIAWYTSSFAVGVAGSFFVAGVAKSRMSAQGVFWLTGAAVVVAACLVWRLTVPIAPPRRGPPPPIWSSLSRILRHRAVALPILAYAGHMWELFALRTWMVTLLNAALRGASHVEWTPTTVAALGNALAIMSNVVAVELARRFGRRVVVLSVQSGCVLAGLSLVAWLPAASYASVATVITVYSMLAQTDSALLYSATVEAAPDTQRGTALAAHSLVGFVAAFVGSVTVGAVIDLVGGPIVGPSGRMALVVIAVGSLAATAAVQANARIGCRDATHLLD